MDLSKSEYSATSITLYSLELDRLTEDPSTTDYKEGYPIASRDSEANENQNMNWEEEASDDQGGTPSTAHTKDPMASSPELIDVRPLKLKLIAHEPGRITVMNRTHKYLVLYKVEDEKGNLRFTPLAGVLFPQEAADGVCLTTCEKGKEYHGYVTFTAIEVSSDTDVTNCDENKCLKMINAYIKVGSPSQKVRAKYHIKPHKLVRRHQSSTSLSIEHNEKQTPDPRHSKSETSVSQTETNENQNTTTITSEDEAEADNEASDTVRDDPGQPPWRTSNNAAAAAAAAKEVRKVRINSKHISVYDEITGEETADALHDLLQTDDEKLEWINLVKEEEERTGNSLHRLQKHVKEEEKTLQGYLEDVEIMLTGTEALLHMLKSLEAEAKELELLLFPADYKQLVELKSEIQAYTTTYRGNIDRMLRQKDTLYRLIGQHQTNLHRNPGIRSVLITCENVEDTRASVNRNHDGGNQSQPSTQSSSRQHNISSNALMAKSGHLKRGPAGNDPGSLNMTSNAGQREKHFTHTIKGRGTATMFQELGVNQQRMEHELTTIRADLHNVDTHTEGLLNMMTELTSKVRANRDGILAGVTGLEEKMKKAGFSLAEIEGEGDRNKATITLLQTNFNAHLDKIMSVLADTKSEQGKMKKQANHLNSGFRKAKKNILRISDGVYEEHKHATQVNNETNHKIDKLSAGQQMAQRILKDMHKDMRIALCKLKHLVCQALCYRVIPSSFEVVYV